MRLPIPKDACAAARRLIATGTDPATLLEFVRPSDPGDEVCLRGSAQAFASRMVKEGLHAPRHVPYVPFDLARTRLGKPPARKKRRPARLIIRN
jgi:hypothetical protein